MKRDKSLTWQAQKTIDFSDKKIGIIGGTGGIGRAFALKFVDRGARVIVVGRKFRDKGIANIDFLAADLSRMKEAEHVGKTLPAEELDILLFSVGIMADHDRQLTADGLEQDTAIGYLSRLVILRNLGPRLGQSRTNDKIRPRVFIMGYPGSGQMANINDMNSEKNYARWKAHSNSVAGNEAMVYDASKRYMNLDVFGLNPGFVQTNMREDIFKSGGFLNKIGYWITSFMTDKPENYVRRVLPLFISLDLTGRSGKYFNKKGEAILPSSWVNDENCKKVMQASENLISQAGVTI